MLRVEKRVPSCTVGGNINRYSHCGEEYCDAFSSVAQSHITLLGPMDYSMPGFPVNHQLSELAPTHVYWVGDAIQPSHPLLFPSPPAFNLSQHQGHFQWVSSSHQEAKVLEFQLQHQSYQWIFRTDFLQDGLVVSPCRPRDFQESSPSPQWDFTFFLSWPCVCMFVCADTSVVCNSLQPHGP